MKDAATVGGPAPELVYTTAAGEQKQLSALWAARPALVLWLRHFGWQFYSEILAQLREKQSEFEKRGVALACVVQGTAEEAARFCGRHGVESLCIPDPEKESYRALGLGRASLWEILFPSDDLKRRRAEAKQAGCSNKLEGARQKHSDIFQLSGAALVAMGGTILWLHRSQHTGDLPSASGLLEIVGKSVP